MPGSKLTYRSFHGCSSSMNVFATTSVNIAVSVILELAITPAHAGMYLLYKLSG
jgi:hypothetical protein